MPLICNYSTNCHFQGNVVHITRYIIVRAHFRSPTLTENRGLELVILVLSTVS